MEEVEHISTARVVLAEYDVIQHDFHELGTDNLVSLNPGLLDLSAERREEAIRSIIDDWLISNSAYISCSQASQAVVNTSIRTDGRRSVAYRPPKYGRAVVVPTLLTSPPGERRARHRSGSVGLLDLKGAGVSPDRIPSSGVQSNGLEYLGLALSDFLVKKAIDHILSRSLPTVWTVPVYAVLDLGFDIIEGFHGAGPAGMHVRRAHRRRLEPRAPAVEHTVTFEIESTLRRYGLTAAPRDLQLHIRRTDGGITWQFGSGRVIRVRDLNRIGFSLALLRDTDALTLDQRDVQTAREVSGSPSTAQMVDFGAIRIESRFDCPLMRDFDGPAISEIIWPGSPDFVQPATHLQLPPDAWNRYALKALCFQLALDFRGRALSRDDVRQQLDTLVLGLVEKWNATPALHMARNAVSSL